MLFYSHLLLGVVLFLATKDFFSGGNQIVFFFLVLLGSIIPDLDEPRSKINQWLGIFGKIIAFFTRHRGILHSLVLYIIVFFVMKHYLGLYYAKGFFLGYIAHILGDIISLRGVELLYPLSSFKIKGPMRVGGLLEWILFGVLFLLIGREIWLMV